MSLLGSIAAALSDGVGGGMVQNAKWGEEKAAQAKKEAADDARLKEQLKRYDLDRQSRDKYYAGLLEESKNERLSREEQARLDRENNLKIAGMRDHGGGGNVTGGALKDLDMLDTAIGGIDKQIAMLSGKLDKEGVTKEDKVYISTQLKNLSSQRTSLINSQEAQRIWSSTGAVGAAHRSMFFRDDAPQNKPGQKDVQQVPPPERPVKTGLLSNMARIEGPAIPLARQQGYTGEKQRYPNSKNFTNPQTGTTDVTSKYLYRQGGTTAADAANALSKLGYHLPDAY